MRRFNIGVVLIALAAFAFGDKMRTVRAASEPPLREGYAGNAACLGCHRPESTGYLQTAHHFTSQLPSSHAIRGSFAEMSNRLVITEAGNVSDPALFFTMTAKDGAFFETASTGFPPRLNERSQRIDLVTGSGKRGQTYLYWDGDRLFELPVSFWTDGRRWINSPGYTDGTADFSRPVHPGCVECHMSYLQPLSADPATNRFNRASVDLGISCETCHGPGLAHAAMETDGKTHPANARLILNPAVFTRDRQVDLCALCHNGIAREPLASAFSYRPGKPLGEFFKPLAAAYTDKPDVHGDQVSLLARSKCYAASPAMTCSTCHQVHASERSTAAYSDRCLSCHAWQSCGVSKRLGHKITANCIDCHMPVQTTNVIVSETAGQEVRATMRTHWIKVYDRTNPDAHPARPGQRSMENTAPRQSKANR